MLHAILGLSQVIEWSTWHPNGIHHSHSHQYLHTAHRAENNLFFFFFKSFIGLQYYYWTAVGDPRMRAVSCEVRFWGRSEREGTPCENPLVSRCIHVLGYCTPCQVVIITVNLKLEVPKSARRGQGVLGYFTFFNVSYLPPTCPRLSQLYRSDFSRSSFTSPSGGDITPASRYVLICVMYLQPAR